MNEYTLSAIADARRADLLREGCRHRRAAAAAAGTSLSARLAGLLPGHGARTKPCTSC